MSIRLHIDPRNGVPMYMQLIEQVKHALEIGSLQPGDSLPPVRELASGLTIAPNTIVKAYTELQRLELIESRPGKGTIVTGKAGATLLRQQIEATATRLSMLIRDAVGLGFTEDELRACFETEIHHHFREQ